jgi:hypothetical protein
MQNMDRDPSKITYFLVKEYRTPAMYHTSLKTTQYKKKKKCVHVQNTFLHIIWIWNAHLQNVAIELDHDKVQWCAFGNMVISFQVP